MKKFWGDNYFNPAAKQFTTDPEAGGKTLQRCFVQFIMRPVIQLCRNIMNGNLDAVWKMLETLNIVLKPDE